MTFRLAETLHLPVRELEQRVTTRELADWVGYWAYQAALQDQAIEVAKMRRNDD